MPLQRSFHRLISLLIFFYSVAGYSHVIVIEGPARSNAKQKLSTEKSYIASSIAEHSLENTYQEQPLIQKNSTGQTSSMNMPTPSIRGQSAQNTEVWYEENLICDPENSYPTFFLFDLYAFDRFTLGLGMSKYKLPSLNPTGYVQFRKKTLNLSSKPSFLVGMRTGYPFLYEQIGKQQGIISDQGWTLRFSLFHKYTNHPGKFEYYNNSGVPTNLKHHKFSIRKNNALNSSTFMPHIELQWNTSQIEFFTYVYDEQTEFNTIHQKSFKNFHSKAHVQLLSYSTKFHSAQGIWPSSLKIGLLHQSQKRSSHTYKAIYTQPLDSTKLNLQNTHVSTTLNWTQPQWKGILQVRLGKSYLGQQFEHFQSLYFGQRIAFSDWQIELKNQIKIREKNNSFSHALKIGYTFNSDWQAYSQIGYFDRQPSLIERLGDNALFKSNPKLKSENQLHVEAGIALKKGALYQLNIFSDQTQQKIITIPASFGQYKSINLQTATINGMEFTFENEWWMKLNLAFGILNTKNPRAGRIFKIPGIAEKTLKFKISKQIHKWSIQFNGKWSSPVFYDEQNYIAFEKPWRFNASLEYQLVTSRNKIQLLFQIENITNANTMGIHRSMTPHKLGIAALSDFPGFPLPGRSLNLSATMELY